MLAGCATTTRHEDYSLLQGSGTVVTDTNYKTRGVKGGRRVHPQVMYLRSEGDKYLLRTNHSDHWLKIGESATDHGFKFTLEGVKDSRVNVKVTYEQLELFKRS